ncbi:bifunctional 5,10-methylenetetrahydrofolate dehydrogenase/5,10-methenyltetrahydrofolate cyclohydrolase [Candidatus Dojkabacteria bacterium]|nr:bifunctional 5,10-methylenetetrahydrofolate dehydrogenase/5,10-methenyltetrahydrofolate cyclohydrolase [Candidatus Dojkabacteria bacterium]
MVIKGDKLAKKKLSQLKQKVKKNGSKIQLDILYIGKSTASDIFIRNKRVAAESLGIKVNIHEFKKDIFHEIIRATCNNLNFNPNCTGYFFQLPIRKDLVEENVLDFIDPAKDVDGLTSTNLGRSIKNVKGALRPATVEAIISILNELKVRLKSKVVTIINDSNLIGKPLSTYLLGKGATVNVCNEFTKDLSSFTKEADIIVSAVGKANLVVEEMVKDKAIVIDAGITKVKGKTVGDVDFENVSKKAGAISPVPGGVGPLTVVCLLENLVKIYETNKE